MLPTYLTSSPHFYTFLYLAVCLLAAFNVLEIIFLLAHKRRVEKNEEKKELLKRRVITGIITVTAPAEVLPEPLDYAEHEAYTEAASSIIDSFEGEIARRATQLIYAFGVDLYFQRLCRNRAWFKRAHAVDILSALKLEKNRDFFADLFGAETSVEVKYRIIYGLSLIACDQEYIHSIAKLLSGLPYLTAKYTEDVFLNVITALKNSSSEHAFTLFLKRAMNDPGIPVRIKRDCVSACYSAGGLDAAPVVLEYYRAFQDAPEMVIVCIKALVRMGEFTILPEALGHADWRVRLTALKYAHLCKPDILPDHETLPHDPEFHFAVLPDILRTKDWHTRLAALKQAHLGNSEVLAALKPMLHDANYHIRLNAALALSRIGMRGMEILRDERTSPDKFASDAARYALDNARSAQ